MRRSKQLFLVFGMFVLCFTGTCFSEKKDHIDTADSMGIGENSIKEMNQREAKDGKSIFIRLGNTHFDPIQGVPVQRQGFKVLKAYQKGEKGYYIVQFDGPPKRSWKKALTVLGVDIFDYIPDFAFIIRMDSTKEQVIRALDHVRWLGIYQPSYKLSQTVQDKVVTDNVMAEESNAFIALRITVFPGEDITRIKADIIALDCYIMDEAVTRWKTTLSVKSLKDRVAGLSAILGVKWIEPVPEWRLLNKGSTDTFL